MEITFAWRSELTDIELDLLDSGAFGVSDTPVNWRSVLVHSLGWVTAREDDLLVGLVNVAWDGGARAFLEDVMVSEHFRRSGIGTELVAVATTRARAAGCSWLHAQFASAHAPFYLDVCGFSPASAGVIAL